MEDKKLDNLEELASRGAEALRNGRVSDEKESGLIDYQSNQLAAEVLKKHQNQKKTYHVIKWVNRALVAFMFGMGLFTVTQRNHAYSNYSKTNDALLKSKRQVEAKMLDTLTSRKNSLDYKINVNGSPINENGSLTVNSQDVALELKFSDQYDLLEGRVPFFIRDVSTDKKSTTYDRAINLEKYASSGVSEKVYGINFSYKTTMRLNEGKNSIDARLCFPVRGQEKVMYSFFPPANTPIEKYFETLKRVADSGNLYVYNPAKKEGEKETIGMISPACLSYKMNLTVKNGKQK